MPWLSDLKIASEVWLVGAAIYWVLPRLVFSEPGGRNTLLRFFGGLTRIALLTSVAVPLLAALHILNAITLLGFYLIVYCGLRISRTALSISASQRWFLVKVAQVEQVYEQKAWRRLFQFRKRLLIAQRSRAMFPIVGTAAIVFLLMAEIHLWGPLHNLRFADPNAYLHLLRTRQLLHDTQPFTQPFVLPAVFSSVALVGATDAMQVTRFLSPLLDILLAIAGGTAIAAIFRSNWVGVFTCFVVGCYAEISAVSEGVIGTFFLLLGIAFLADYFYHSHRRSLYDALCAFALLALALPRAFPREIALILLFSCILGFAAHCSQRWLPPAYHPEALLTLLVMVGIFIAAPPVFPQPRFLEYETTARASLWISETLPGQRWTIVAPAEQFSETFGMGQYEDLSQFVKQYQDRAGDPSFYFPYQTLFVFVEKRPFQYFATEPLTVSFSTLTDPTYRNYRSPAGRSSLELSALKLCNRYADVHPARVFYEDDDLRIYEFSHDKDKSK